MPIASVSRDHIPSSLVVCICARVVDQHIVAAVVAAQPDMIRAVLDLAPQQFVVDLLPDGFPQTSFAGIIAANQHVERFVGCPTQHDNPPYVDSRHRLPSNCKPRKKEARQNRFGSAWLLFCALCYATCGSPAY